jgi:AbrB family looped-hinge helix DNA binding protein
VTVMEARVTSEWQVTLPVALRERLGIAPGDSVTFVEQPDGTFVLARAPRHAKAPGDQNFWDWVDDARARTAWSCRSRDR